MANGEQELEAREELSPYTELSAAAEPLVPIHASQHSAGGSDPVTPAAIGAATVADLAGKANVEWVKGLTQLPNVFGGSIADAVAGHVANGIKCGNFHAMNCTDIPDGSTNWGFNVMFFTGEHIVVFAKRSYSAAMWYAELDSAGWEPEGWVKIPTSADLANKAFLKHLPNSINYDNEYNFNGVTPYSDKRVGTPPPGSPEWMNLLTLNPGAFFASQLGFGLNASGTAQGLYFRSRWADNLDSAWFPWIRLATSADLAGKVSKDGDTMTGNLAIGNGHGQFESGLFDGRGYLKLTAVNGADTTRIQLETGEENSPYIERIVNGVKKIYPIATAADLAGISNRLSSVESIIQLFTDVANSYVTSRYTTEEADALLDKMRVSISAASEEARLLGQMATDEQLERIALGQQYTDLELMILGGTSHV